MEIGGFLRALYAVGAPNDPLPPTCSIEEPNLHYRTYTWFNHWDSTPPWDVALQVTVPQAP